MLIQVFFYPFYVYNSGVFGGGLGHGPLGQNFFLHHRKNLENLVFPFCVSNSGSPLFEIINMSTVYYVCIQCFQRLNMPGAMLRVACLLTVLCAVISMHHGSAGLSVDEDDVGRIPERPTAFDSPDELRDYLRALNEYFAVVGRPRSVEYREN